MSDFKKYKGFLFDLDGVVWLGDHIIPGVPEVLGQIRAGGHKLCFVTNNASKQRSHFCKKLASMGIEAAEEEIVNSGYATAKYLFNQFGSCAAHVMGTDQLEAEMLSAGHTIVERGADTVVVGYDREFNWEKLDRAFQNIHCDGARFVACNLDAQYPEKDGPRPGNGANVAALAASLGREPELVVGKPSKSIFEIALQALGCAPEECLMVGDRLDTDIKGALESGVDTLFVLSGIGTMELLEKSGIKPSYILPSLADLDF